jgi:8-oxo-dGTP diphosphatase
MDRQAGDRVDEAIDAAQGALAALRAMPGSQERVDGASRLARELRTISIEATSVLREEAWRIKDEEKLSLAPLSKRLGVSRTRAAEFLHARPDEPPETEEPSTKPEPAPVVVAIVSSHLGVLIAKRRDGKPPVSFISGEIEPGESPADAAVREVKEETGLGIKAGRIIGRRIHPATNRALTYMAAWPATADTDISVVDEEELADVSWMSYAEVTGLLGDSLFEPVRKHLKRTLEG